MNAPKPALIKHLADYFQWWVEQGCGDFAAALDQRGMLDITKEHHNHITFCIPPDGEMKDKATSRIFLRANY